MNPWIPHLLRAGAGGGGPVLPPTGRTMLANLTSSLILEEGTGGPTWSRATKAWRFNELGYLEELASGCAAFGGARLVRNFIRNSALDNATWTNTGLTITTGQTDYLGGTSAFLLMETAATSNHDIRDDGVSPGAGRVMIISVVAKANGRDQIRISDNAYGAVSATFNLSSETAVSTIGTSTITSLGGGYYKCIAKTSGSLANNAFYPRIYIYNGNISYAGDITKGVILSHVQVSSVTNYDASYVPEYVSVGVPLNTVRTTSEDFSNAAWVKSNCTVTGTNVLVCSNSTADNSVNQATDVSVPTTAGQYFRYSIRAKSISGGVSFVQIGGSSTSFGATAFCTFSLVDGTYSAQAGVTANVAQISSDTYEFSIRLLCTVTTPSSDVFYVSMQNGLSDTRKQSFVGDGVKSFQLLRAWSVNVTGYNAYYVPPYYAVGVGTNVYFGAGIDGAKYFETDWQGAPIAAANLLGFRRESAATNNLLHSRDLSNAAWSTKTNITAAKTATGLDGIANTATTLTATAADAIILQPITLASAARCASAYVKRRTGTGTISFTQDGGSTWTDITAQINSSTWSRVQITSTLANPSVGFKISTSGDAIDVDCAQNEAGAVATSPIVTTTATVTRNAESLTYQTAGNIDFAVGTIYCEVQSTPTGSNRNAVAPGNSSCNASNSSSTSWRAFDGTTVVEKTGLSDISTGKRKRANSWGPANTKVTGDGLTPASGAFDGLFGDGAILYIAQNFQGYIGPIAIWNYQMAEAEQQAITT